MSDLRKTNKSLYDWYDKQFKALEKQRDSDDNLMDYFILRLKYLRDFSLLKDGLGTKEMPNIKLNTLAKAVAEYELYKLCACNYYKLNGKAIERLNKEKTEEEVQREFNAERSEHWAKFWQYVALNVEDWQIYDPVQ